MKQKNAIILCSGGIDSVTTAYYVKRKLNYNKITLLFFDYGQRAIKEEKRAVKYFSKKIDAKFVEVKLDFFKNMPSLLVNKKGKIKRLKRSELKDTKKESEKFYVPLRNLLFLSYALSIAESRYIKNKEINDIFVGFKCEGKEAYPDTTQEFVDSMNKLSKNTTIKKFQIKAPLINKDKEDIISLGAKLRVNFKETISCYSPIMGHHCGNCLACKLRQEGFYWANVKDPTGYGIDAKIK